ncbi:MAG TPA: permease prefix domain 1-containing protein [Kofleriaceae bacterium]|nr:permease prefix domain 1-containing protein [Kofleriaceae bacterium]
MFASRDELRRFIAELRIPEPRRPLVEHELFDHLDSAVAAAIAAGRTPAEAERTALHALGDPAELRRSLERIESAFDLEPRRVIAIGLGSTIAVSIGFALIGAQIQRTGTYALDLVLAIVAACAGLVVMWLAAPRGIGAAVWAEARATVEPRRQVTPRRRAAIGYVVSMVAVFFVVFFAFITGLAPEAICNDILAPWAFLGLGYGIYALIVMRRARGERAPLRATRGT